MSHRPPAPARAPADLRPRLAALAAAGDAAAAAVLRQYAQAQPITLADLTALLEDADPARIDQACWLLGRLGRKAAAPALLALLRGDRAEHWWPAATALAQLGSRRTLRPLLAIMAGASPVARREAAAYALAFGFIPGAEALLSAAFVAILGQGGAPPAVRAQAAEGLANLHELGDPAEPLFQQARDALLAALPDPAPEVRFWSAFALGNLRAVAALPALQALTGDPAEVPGWWTVGEEAGDAIVVIQGGERPARVPRPRPTPLELE